MNRKAFSVFSFLVLACCLLILSACNRGGRAEPTPTPTATPTSAALPVTAPVNAAGAAPTSEAAGSEPDVAPSTALPLPTPTPTIETPPTAVAKAADRLAAGRTLHRHGRYDAARQVFADLAETDAAEPVVQAAARFDLARAYLADGYDTEALAALDALPRTLDPAAAAPGVLDTTDWSAKVDFLRGQALHGLGRDDEALAAYTAALTAAPMLAETVAPRLGQLHLNANNLDEAAAAYRQAADSLRDGRGVVAYVLLLEALADIQRSAGNYAGAVESYDEILGVAQNGGYRADIQQRAGAMLAAAGDEAGAIERWRAATAEAPDSQFAYDALVELVNRDADFDLYQRGYIDLAAEAWLPAINAYQAFLDTAAADDEPARTGPPGAGRGLYRRRQLSGRHHDARSGHCGLSRL